MQSERFDPAAETAALLRTARGAGVGTAARHRRSAFEVLDHRDPLKMLLGERGAHLLFEKVAVQPGRPTWHARFSGGPLVLGLPGNPVAAFVGGNLFLRPLLHALAGARGDPFRLVPARLASALPAGNDRETFLGARLSAGDDGRLLVAPDPRRDSSLQAALAAANALLRRRAGAPPAGAGAFVEVLPLGALH